MPPDPTLGLMPFEATLGGAGGGGEGLVNVTAAAPLVAWTLGDDAFVGIAAEAALGAGSGWRAGGGLTALGVVGGPPGLRLAGRAGGWAERSPVGTAYGPYVAAQARLFFVRLEAGAVVAGAPVWHGRAVLELPLVAGGAGALPFVGVGVEARRYGDAARTLWLVALTAGL